MLNLRVIEGGEAAVTLRLDTLMVVRQLAVPGFGSDAVGEPEHLHHRPARKGMLHRPRGRFDLDSGFANGNTGNAVDFFPQRTDRAVKEAAVEVPDEIGSFVRL